MNLQFGHTIFYSPMSIVSINIIQISNLASIIIEHLPQMIAQIIVIFVKLKKFNSLVWSFVTQLCRLPHSK